MASFHSSCLSRSVKGRITVQKRLTRARKANSLSVEETRTLSNLGIFSEKIKKIYKRRIKLYSSGIQAMNYG